ncbi:MAG: histidine phosphatase family protein [Candidatus Dormiibacterota bacterium]
MTIYLVKEADSGSPGSWPGPSRLRPITREGRRQARALVACLEGRPISRILTGPNLRCRETVMPLADARDLVIESDHALGEVAEVDRALAVVRGTAARPLLVCTHSSLVDAMVGRLLLDGWLVEDGADLTDGFVWLVEDVVVEAS